MTSQIEKDLDKLTKKQRQKFRDDWAQILTMQWDNLDVKKLSGTTNVYRKRFGQYRIVFLKTSDTTVELYRIVKRDENTYKK